MALFMNQGNALTVAKGATLYCTWVYPGSADSGPQYIEANFIGGNSNYGTVTTVQTSVICFNTDNPNEYYPQGISYSGVLRNDGDFPVLINFNIGNFQ
jgi:hypothetical protein